MYNLDFQIFRRVMRNTVCILMVLMVVCGAISFLQLPAQISTEADSLLEILNKDPGNADAHNHLNNLVKEAFYRDAGIAMKIVNSQLEYAHMAEDQVHIAKTLLNKGIIFDLSGIYDSSLHYYTLSMEQAVLHDLHQIKGDIYNNFSITYAVLGRMEESVSNALKSLKIFEQLGDSARMARIYNNLGSRYYEMEYMDRALEFYDQAAVINEEIGDRIKLAFNYGNIGLIYYEKFNNEKALKYFWKSIQLQDTLNDRYHYSIGLHNLALAYRRLEAYDSALAYDRHSYAIAEETNDELGKITSLNGQSATYRAMGDYRESLNYLYRSAGIAEQINARYYLMSIYENLADLYSQLNDFQHAFTYYQKFTALKDSILTSEKDRAVQRINEYEEDKMQQEIKLLTMDSEIQKLNVRRQKVIRNSITVVTVLMILLATGVYQRYRYVRRTRNELSEKNDLINLERERSDNLLLNILPGDVARELKETGRSEARYFEEVTVLFTDFKGFTRMAEIMTAQELVNEIDHCFKNFDEIILRHGIEKIKTIGDAYMCAGGLQGSDRCRPHQVVEAALEIQQFMENLKQEKIAQGKPYFELRIGIHTGPVVAGVVGTKKFQYDIWGDTVNIASRMESSGEVGMVNISQTTYDIVKHRFVCTHRGKIEAKNKGPIDMYFVEGYVSSPS